MLVIGLLSGFSVLLFAYLVWIRSWQLRWGATDEEVARAMPGDDLVSSPHFNATRAVTIDAPPERIWPWLVQIGFNRAGWYSYDWIDNLGRPSAVRIIPELQTLSVGDRIPLSRWTYETVLEIVPNRFMVWQGGEGSDITDGSWVWGLYPVQEDGRSTPRTRLVVRMRGRYNWHSPSILLMLVVDVFDIVMVRKCLLGIKKRAEGKAVLAVSASRDFSAGG